MRRSLSLALALLVAGVGFSLSNRARAQDRHVTIRLRLSVKSPNVKRDWSGKVTITQGQIVSVRKGYNGPNDTVRPDHSWEIVHGRGLPNGRPGRKSLLIEVDAPPTATASASGCC